MRFSDYSRRTPEQLVADMNAAWDRIKNLSATNDRQQQKIIYLERKLDSRERKLRNAEIKLWVLSAALVALWEVVKLLIFHH